MVVPERAEREGMHRAQRSLPSSPADVCAVVVTYFPDADCAQNLRAIASQVAELLVVDNGSSRESLEEVEATVAQIGARLLRFGENRGIAAALNSGLAFARERGYRWLATFDQDSLATAGMIANMIASLGVYPHPELAAVITPIHVDRRLHVSYALGESLASGEGWRELRTAMTSGNLVNVTAAMSVGGFDATLFIDYVDHEFCMRLRRNGYHIIEASGAVLRHSLGEMEVRSLLWRRPRVTHHSPTRRYYITRNRLIVWRQNLTFDLRWTLRDMRSFLYELGYIVLWEQEAPKKMRAVARGVLDGIRNARGKFDF